MKFPIAFSSLICDILINQKSHILTSDDVIGVPPSPLNFSYKLFGGKYVQNIVLRTFQILMN